MQEVAVKAQHFVTLLATAMATGVVIVAALWPMSAEAQASDDALMKCRAILDPGYRLNCYDGLAAKLQTPAATQPSGVPETMNLLELKVDKEKLIGRLVTTTGRYVMMGDMGMLQADIMDVSPVEVDIAGPDRETRKMLLNCGMQGCSLKIVGRVVRLPLGIGLKATQAIEE